MMEYQYMITEEQANTEAARLADELKTNTGNSDFVQFAADVIIKRIAKNPLVYLEYGVYWPALKKVLNNHQAELGKELINDPIAGIYGNFASEAAVIAAAEQFREFYKEAYLKGSNSFQIDELGNIWTLYDSDIQEKT